MKIPSNFYFIVFAGLSTCFVDFYFSSTDWILTLFAFSRFLAVLFAFVVRIIDEKSSQFWDFFKNLFVIIAAIQQAFVLYRWTSFADLWAILFVIHQVSMPLFSYLWIRRIQREDLSLLQKIWLEIVGIDRNLNETIRFFSLDLRFRNEIIEKSRRISYSSSSFWLQSKRLEMGDDRNDFSSSCCAL